MKALLFQLLLFVLVIQLVGGCVTETENPKNLNLSLNLLTNAPRCKFLKSVEISDTVPYSESCLLYTYESSFNKLTLKHLNAGFNCCPEGIQCTVVYKNDTITIKELEINSGCNCDCLFDLEMEVSDLVPGKYQLMIIEPYAGDQEKINFTLDLQKEKQGSYCVSRTQYPWGI